MWVGSLGLIVIGSLAWQVMKKKLSCSRESGVPIESILEPHQNNLRGVPLNKSYPEKAAEWYYPKNCGFGPEDFSYGSKIIAWWQCSENRKHIFEMRILSRTLKDQNCPFCSGRRVCPDTCLAAVRPDIARQWHQKKNGELTPEDFTVQSSQSVVWKCDRGHEWKATIKSRFRGKDCPKCPDWRLLNLSDYPAVLKLFDKSKNHGLNPHRLTTTMDVWWKCPKGPDHSWAVPFRKKADTLRCPFCSFRLPSVTNRLDILYPEVAKELHPTRNGKLKAKDLTAHAGVKVWWKCPTNPRHLWETSVNNRTVNGSGCPECWTKKLKSGYFKELAQQRKKSRKA